MLRSALAFLPMAVIAVAVVLAGRGPGPEDLPQLLLQPTPQSPPGPRLDPGLLGEGWEEAFEPETFGPEELYAKINGGADVYLSHGFRQLKVHSFLHASSGDYVEAFLFDQGEQARVMYDLERPPDAVEDPGFGGYFSAASLFMTRGALYVQIQAASDTPRTREAVRALGTRLLELSS